MARDTSHGAGPHYRADIDGLRAVAVLLVLADHLRTRLSGGYIGVDVFFVISGYLISAHILSEMARGRFSIVDFYERRIRRIFPALLVLLIVVSALVWAFFVPSEMVAYGRSLLATLLSGSNILFWSEAGYFDAPSALKPLLHTWSLGVEEQFYIFFPLFLVAVRRWWPARLKLAIWTVFGISLAAAAALVFRAPQTVFFWSPLRAWELLAGTVLSQGYIPRVRGAAARNLASAAGLLLILVPAFLYTDLTPFPGLAAFPPVLGSVLIIAAGETGDSWVGRLLASPPMVFVGLISYSLYLWHWPVIVFQTTSSILFAGVAISTRQKLIEVVVSLALATLSWRFVEQPFRKGRWKPGRTAVFALNGAVVAVLGLAAFAMLGTRGFPGRFPADAQRVAEALDYDQRTAFREGTCLLEAGTGFASFNQSVCLPPPNGRRSILLLGDSHAADLLPGFNHVFADHQILQADATGCRMTVSPDDGGSPVCRRLADFIFGDFLLRRPVDVVLLAGRWQPGDAPAVGRTIAYLKAHGIHTVLLGPAPEFPMPEPRVVALALRARHPERIAAQWDPGPHSTDAQFKQLAASAWDVPYISLYDDLCRPDCPVYGAPGVPLLTDRDHFTAEGSALVAARIRDLGQLP